MPQHPQALTVGKALEDPKDIEVYVLSSAVPGLINWLGDRDIDLIPMPADLQPKNPDEPLMYALSPRNFRKD
jgi:hypothetical protein